MQDSRLDLHPTAFPVPLLEDPARHAKRMSSAAWLYLLIRAAARPRTGRLQVTVETLASAAGIKPETTLSLLGRLKTGGYVQFQRNGEQLQILVSLWSLPPVEEAVTRDAPEQADNSVAGALARRIAERLDDEGRLAHYEDLVEENSTHAERALREALAVPAENIRKSRAALFDYLFRMYAQQNDTQDC